jgi:hypothetical protein
MSDPIIFSKLGSDNEIQNPVIGGAGTIGGSISYASAKFGNGATLNTTNYITFPDFYNNKFTVEFWAKMGHNHNDSTNRAFLYAVGGSRLYMIKTASNIWNVWIYSATGNAQPASGYAFNMTTTYSTNDIIHFAVTGDNTQGANSKIKLYINNTTQVFNSLIAGFDQVWIPVTNILYLGSSDYNPAITMDNVKVYDYVKTDFSDRFDERGGMNDQIIIT